MQITVKKTIEIKANQTIDVLENGKAYYNYQGNHFRVFKNEEDALDFIKTNNDNLVVAEFDDEEALDYYLETGISSINDIEDLEHKALILKETFEQMKQMSESDEDKISDELLIEETIAFLVQDEVYQGDERELRFICDNMDISMIERCSCCGVVLMPDDEAYGDELNDDAPLCDHCSIFNEETDMYQKAVHQDVIEKLTGLSFSVHLKQNSINEKVEDFNYWLNENNHHFTYKDNNARDLFSTYLQERTALNICDACGCIEYTLGLKWIEDDEFSESEEKAVNFLAFNTPNIFAVCDDCLNKAVDRTILPLNKIVERIRENQMIFRVGDLVVLQNVDFTTKSSKPKTYMDYIVSVDEKTKTYKLKEYGDDEFTEDEFYDIANEAYVYEYRNFIVCYKPEISEDVDEWSDVNHAGIPQIESAFEDFGYKNEFIAHLKDSNLSYSRLLTPKFKVGDTFTVHFDYYKDGEVSTHQIISIDKSFTEAEEIVYWSDDSVYITESELEKQMLNEQLDEVEIVRNDLMHNIFCLDEEDGIVVPTFKELVEACCLKSEWTPCEKYEDFSYDSLINEIKEQSENFFIALEALEKARKNFKKGN